MPASVKPIPEGYHTATPYLVVDDGAKAIDFYKRAFGATQVTRMDSPQGRVVHAELKIGDSMIMLGEEMGGGDCRSPKSLGGTTSNVFLYVKDVDATVNKALAAGGKPGMEIADMFWGDRYGKVTDPFGHVWSVATHKEDVAPAEMKRRADDFFAKMGGQQHKTGTA